MRPPRQLDGADVLHLAVSHPKPFFVMEYATESSPGSAVHGLAVCQYATGQVYRFSCDESWEVQNDFDFPSVEAALGVQSGQYDTAKLGWQRW